MSVTAGPVSWFRDGLINLLSGLGGPQDKAMGGRWVFTPLLQVELEAAYRGDWISRKVVDIPAQDATREWRHWQADDKQIGAIEAEEKRLKLQSKVKQAMIKARLYGGSALIMGVNQGGSNMEPLEVERVGKGALQFVHVVAQHELSAGQLITQLDSPWFGEPEYYMRSIAGGATSDQLKIHPSRVVRFVGAHLPDTIMEQGTVWGDSVLQAVNQAVQNASLVSGSIASLIDELKVDVYKIPDLSERIANKEYQELLRNRFAYANMVKSTNHALVMDKEEEWDRVQLNVAGMPDLQKQYLLIAAAAADIPATRFLAQSPVGLNATGDSDIRNYYDNISDDQNNDLTPRLERLDEVLVRSSLGDKPDNIYFEWESLWQVDDEQKAKNAQLRAQAFKIDVDSGLIPDPVLSEARVNQLVEDGTYPGLDGLMENFDYEKLFGPADEPPVPELPPALPGAPGAPAAGGGPAQPPRLLPPPARAQDAVDRWRRMVRDAAPRPLYVWRAVLNARDIIKWAQGQGFRSTVPLEEMHVTIIYSKEAVDWMAVGTDGYGEQGDGTLAVPPGGPRLVEQFSDGAVVLEFSSSRLQWRHTSMRDRGASYDYDEYRPHVTITYDPEGVILDDVEPYRGPIVLGPEVFEEIRGAFDPSQLEEVEA
jgi:uncharacterized protein